MTNETWKDIRDISVMVVLMALLGGAIYQTVTYTP